MARRYGLNKRRPFKRWKPEPLRQRRAEILVCAMRNPFSGGGYDRNGDGTAGWKADVFGPWWMERTIKRGRWSGPWRRVKGDW